MASQAAPNEAGGSVSIGKGGAKGKAKGKRKKREKSPEDLAELEKPWIERWAPENNQLDVGMYLGGFFLSENHGLFDPGFGDKPQVKRQAFDLGFRATYFPIRFVGVGIEGGFVPTRSDELGTRATIGTFRAHVMAQLAYRITPTVVIGGGMLSMNSPSPELDAADGAFHWGPGIKMHINKWIAARIDGRHLVTSRTRSTNDKRSHHGEILFGVDVTLRFRRILKDRGTRLDSDGDGIDDKYDSCPNEAGDGDDGCPVDRDSDGDGLPDSRDRCPKEWGDTPNGCPVPDSDGDAIMDVDDHCPEEPENYNKFQDKDGCPDERPQEIEEFNGVVKGITFASGKAKIRKGSNKTLNRAVRVLNKYPELRMSITGHTDSTGGHDSNVDLSRRRAEAVKTYLVEKGGIDGGRLETAGKGPDEPVADNGTKAGRAENRRIEFKLID